MGPIKITRVTNHGPLIGYRLTMILNRLSAIIQLRTGHAPLNHHLESPSPLSHLPQLRRCRGTVHHFLFMCPAYEAPRRNLWVKVRPQKMDFKASLPMKTTQGTYSSSLHKPRDWHQPSGILAPPNATSKAAASRFSFFLSFIFFHRTATYYTHAM